MMIDTINLNHLRIFECVYRSGSMTAAAEELHLTQPGVSQHIRSLEDILGVKLFDRIQRRLIPTGMALLLFKKCSESLYKIEQVLSELKGGEVLLSGNVNIGVPTEFGNNVILPLLAQFCKQHSQIRFSIQYGLASHINKMLLDGVLDFAFVDGFGTDKRITTETVYHETLQLCAAHELLKKYPRFIENKEFFESLEYIDYQAGETVLRMWFDHHFGYKNLNLKTRATIMNVQGVAQMIQGGLAVGILPTHLADKLKGKDTPLHYFKGCGKALKNGISIGYLKEKTQSLGSRHLMHWLLSQLKT
jgi:DNA-binding transcriptional LysR family regulator